MAKRAHTEGLPIPGTGYEIPSTPAAIVVPSVRDAVERE
jgi:hypothetical protein